MTRDADVDADSASEDGATLVDEPTILAVDDEQRVVEAFDLWLNDDYEVLTATDGETALELASEDVDLVLLDRHMPGLSGDEVLTALRDAGYDCRVAMVTAVDPDFDIVDMPFDHYVAKPVDAAQLRDVTERLLEFETYDDRLNELYRAAQKIATLETEKSAAELADDDRYESLVERRDDLEATLEDVSTSLDASDHEDLFGLTGESS